MATQQERFALATHFYVRLRRHMNRIVDAVWMSENADYAREILRIARAQGHPELLELVERYESLLSLQSIERVAEPSVREPRAAEHYVGALR